MLLRKFALPPVAKAALTSCTMMAAGDVVMQRLQHAQLAKESKAHAPAHALDWARTARFAVIGLTLHGPLFYAGFKQLDKLLGTAPTLGTVRGASGGHGSLASSHGAACAWSSMPAHVCMPKALPLLPYMHAYRYDSPLTT